MHHFPSSGTKDNNKIFSNCSRAQMEKVIAGKKKANGSCFKGIGIVEETQLQAIKFVGDLSFWLTGQRSTRIRPTYILIL